MNTISLRTGINYDCVQDALFQLRSRGLLGSTGDPEKYFLTHEPKPFEYAPKRIENSPIPIPLKADPQELDTRKILSLIMGQPGISEEEVRDTTGLSLHRVHSAIIELLREGFVSIETVPPSTSRYYPKTC